ncbi:MAG: hypothetical protein GXY34_05330, partial [Syntrophomonadaceae bacterium]|nr:hypothetical protein [Syntrophomonadaceae bacterium]
NGQTANTNNLTVAAKAVSGIAVKTQPTKLSYIAGESLDLSGLEATLTYNDSTTEDVAFADFAGKSISVDIANGTAMVVATHNGVPVTLTCNAQTATTSNLTVAAAADKTALNAKIAEAATLTATNYTAASWTTLTDALTAANTVSTDADATTAQVTTGLNDLTSAMTNLVYNYSTVAAGNKVGATATVNATISNSRNLNTAVTVIFQLMDGTTPIQQVALTGDVQTGEVVTAIFNLPSATGTYTCNVLIWDSLTGQEVKAAAATANI